MEIFDELHSNKSKHDALRGMKENVLKGYRAGGNPPFGFKLVRHTFGENIDKRPIVKTTLEVDPDKGPTVTEYFRRRALGEPRKPLCKELKIHVSTGFNMERNIEAYLGHTVWNKHNGRDKDGYYGGERFRPQSEWVKTANTHEPLVDEATAKTILNQLNTYKHRGRRPKISSYILTGVLVCSECGAGFTGGGGGLYRCKNAGDTCDNGRVIQRAVEGAVWGWFISSYLDAQDFEKAMNRIKRKIEKEAPGRVKLIADSRKKIKALDAKITRNFALYEDGQIERAEINSRVRTLEDEKLNLERVIVENTRTEGQTPDFDFAKLKDYATSLTGPDSAMTRRAMLAKAVEKVVIYPKGRDNSREVLIVYRYADGQALEHRTRLLY